MRLGEALAPPGLPRLGTLVTWGASWGIAETTVVRSVFGLYVGALVTLLLGWQTRVSAGVAWVTHRMMLTTAWTSIYGVDMFAAQFLFYLLVFPAGAALALDTWRRQTADTPSVAAQLGLWMMRVHLCIVYCSGGVAKATGGEWWTGDAIWYALMRPELSAAFVDLAWIAHVPWLAMLAGWGTLVVEVGYPALLLPRRRRLWGLAAVVALHVSIILTLGLVSFGALMIVLNVAAFGIDPTPRDAAAAHGETRAGAVHCGSALAAAGSP